MKKIVRKSVTWLLIFGMVFTPLMTSLDLVSTNAEEGDATISVPRDNLTDENSKRADKAEAAQAEGNKAAVAAAEAQTAADNAQTAADNAKKAYNEVTDLLGNDATGQAAADKKLVEDANQAVKDANDAVEAANGLIEDAKDALDAANTAEGNLQTAEGNMNTAKTTASTKKGEADTAISNAKDSKDTVNTKKSEADTAEGNMNAAVANAENTTDVDAKVAQAIADMKEAEQSVSETVSAIDDANVAIGVAKASLETAINDKTDAQDKINTAEGKKSEIEQDVKNAKDIAEAAVTATEKAVEDALLDETTFGAKPMEASEAAVKAAETAKEMTEELEKAAAKSASTAENIATTANERMIEGAGREELVGYVESANAAAEKATEYAKAAQEAADEANKAKDKAEEIYNYLKNLYDTQLAALEDAEQAYNNALDDANKNAENVNKNEVDAAKAAISKSDASIDKAGSDIGTAQTKIGAADTALETAKNDIDTADSSVKDAADAIDNQNKLIDDANEAIDTYNEKAGDLNSAIDTSNGLVDAANGAIDEAETAIIAENGAIDSYNDAVEAYNEAIEAANDAIDKLDYTEAEQKIAAAKQALSEAKTALDNANQAVVDAQAKVNEAEGYAGEAETEAKKASDQTVITEAAAKTTKNDLAMGKFGQDYDTFVNEAEGAQGALDKAHEDYDQVIADNQALLDGEEGKPGLSEQKKTLENRIKTNKGIIDDADDKGFLNLEESDREKAEKYVKKGVGGRYGLFNAQKVSQSDYDWAVKFLADLKAAEEQLANDEKELTSVNKDFDNATKAVSDGNAAIKAAEDVNNKKQQALSDANKYVDGFKLTSENAVVIDKKTQELLAAYAELKETNDDTNEYEGYVGADWPWNAGREMELEDKYKAKWYQFLWVSDEVIYDNMVTIVNDEAVIVCENMEQLAAMKASMADVIAKAKAAEAETAKANAATAAQNAKDALDAYNQARAALKELVLKTENDINTINKNDAPEASDKYDLENDSKSPEELDNQEYEDVKKTDVEKMELKTDDDKLTDYDETEFDAEKENFGKSKDKASGLEVPGLGIDLQDEDIIAALTKLGITVEDLEKFESDVEFPDLSDLLEKVNIALENWEETKKLAEEADKLAEDAKKDADKAKREADKAKHALDTYDEYTKKKDDGPAGGDIPGEEEPFELPTAGAASAVAGVRRNLVADAGDAAGEEVVADTTGTKVEEPVIIEEEELPAAKQPAQSATTIDDEPLPEAKAPEKEGFPWWILLIIAALGLGYAGYKYYDKKKNEDKVA